MGNSLKQFLYQLMISAGGQVAISGRSLVVSFVFAASLDKADFGFYSILIPLLLFFMSLNSALIFEPMTYVISRSNLMRAGEASDFFALFLVFNGLLIIIAFVIFILISGDQLSALQSVAIYISSGLLLEFARRINLIEMDVVHIAISDWVNFLAVCGLLFALNYYDLLTLPLGLLVVSMISILQAIFLLKKIDIFFGLSISGALGVLKINSRFIFRNLCTFCTSVAYVYANPIFVYWAYGLESNAEVEATRLFLAPLHLLNMALGQIAFQYLSRAINQDRIAFKKVMLRAILAVSTLGVTGALIVNFAYNTVSNIFFNGAYAGHHELMVVLSTTYLVEGVGIIVVFGLKTVACFRAINIATFFAAISNLILLFSFSSNGAEWILGAKMVSSAIACGVMILFLRRSC